MKKFILLIVILLISLSLFSNEIPANCRIFLLDKDGGRKIYSQYISDSLDIELLFIQSLNKLGFYNINIDTVLPDFSTLISDYDVLFLSFAWEKYNFLSPSEVNSIKGFLNTDNKSVYVEGNNFVEYYTAIDPAFLQLLGVHLISPGNDIGNVDSLFGVSGSLSNGLFFSFPFGTPPDSSVDLIYVDTSASGKHFDVLTEVKSKYILARSVGHSRARTKDNIYLYSNNVIVQSAPFGAMCNIHETSIINGEIMTYNDLYMQKIMSYFGWANILIVEDDNDDGSVQDVKTLFANENIPYMTYYVSNGNDGPNDSLMSFFDIVIWVCGEESLNTFTDNDQLYITDYIEQSGGKIFTISSYAAQNSNLSGFLNALFQCSYSGNIINMTNDNYLNGDTGSIMEGFSTNIDSCITNSVTSNISKDILKIQFNKDIYNVGNTNERLTGKDIYFSFSTKYIGNSTDKGNLFLRALDYLDYTINGIPYSGIVNKYKRAVKNNIHLFNSSIFISGNMKSLNVNIYSLSGRKILKFQMNNEKYIFEKTLKRGVYLIVIQDSNGFKSYKNIVLE
ncbi:T9SS type A sorting domain-containing protein [candidate division WOR-3 bacterium]|nr:T9SS type A sorting domain-containing protein [candidate division WOR-3 bacterium]